MIYRVPRVCAHSYRRKLSGSCPAYTIKTSNNLQNANRARGGELSLPPSGISIIPIVHLVAFQRFPMELIIISSANNYVQSIFELSRVSFSGRRRRLRKSSSCRRVTCLRGFRDETIRDNCCVATHRRRGLKIFKIRNPSDVVCTSRLFRQNRFWPFPSGICCEFQTTTTRSKPFAKKNRYDSD